MTTHGPPHARDHAARGDLDDLFDDAPEPGSFDGPATEPTPGLPHDEPTEFDVPGADASIAERAHARPRLPIHDEESEQAVLGSALIDTDAAALAFARLSGSDFYNGPHGDTFEAMRALFSRTGALDIVLLREELRARGVLERVGGTGFLSRVLASTPTAANAKLYVERVESLALLRRERDEAYALLAARSVGDVNRAGLRLAHARDERRRRTLPPGPLFSFLGAGELLRTPIPPIDWIVGDGLLFRKGLSHLVAPHKRGKSLAGIGLACSLVRKMVYPADDSLEWLGSPILTGCPVVYLSGEGGPIMLKSRIEVIERHLADDLDALRLLAQRPFPSLSNALHLEALGEEVRRIGAGLLVVDPLSRFWNVADENDAAEQTRFMGSLREFAETYNVAVLTIHHDSKAIPEGDAVTGGRSSSVLANEVDALVNLRRDRDGDRKASEVYFQVRHGDGPDPCKVRVNRDTLLLDFVCRLGTNAPAERAKREARADAPRSDSLSLLDALTRECQTRGRAVTREEWATAAGISVATLKRRMADDEALAAAVAREAGGAGGARVTYRPA